MGLFQDSLKKWFYTNNSSAASSDARVPLLNANGTPKGSDTMANLASVLGETPFLIPLFKYETSSSDTTIKYAKISIKSTSGIGSPIGDCFNIVTLTSARVTYFRILNSVHSNFNKRVVLEALIPSGNNSFDERKIVYDDGSAVYVPFTMGISVTGAYGNNATITIVNSPSGTAMSTENYKVIQ